MGGSAARGRGGPYEFVHQIWPAHPRHLGPLRSEVRRWLAPLALTGDTEDGLVCAVAEAASNCVEHAYASRTAEDTVEVTFWTEPDAVYLEIVDHGRWRTPPEQPPHSGSGLHAMQRLTGFVLIHHDSHGTRVLLRHPLPGDPSALHLAGDG